MDGKVWQEYEQQHQQIKKEYRRYRLRILLIWLGYFVASTAVLRLVVYPWRMEAGVAALLFNTAVSVFLMLFAINRRLKEEQAAREALIEKAPVGNIQL